MAIVQHRFEPLIVLLRDVDPDFALGLGTNSAHQFHEIQTNSEFFRSPSSQAIVVKLQLMHNDAREMRDILKSKPLN